MLAERLREPAERAVVADVLQKTLNVQVPLIVTGVSSWFEMQTAQQSLACHAQKDHCCLCYCLDIKGSNQTDRPVVEQHFLLSIYLPSNS